MISLDVDRVDCKVMLLKPSWATDFSTSYDIDKIVFTFTKSAPVGGVLEYEYECGERPKTSD